MTTKATAPVVSPTQSNFAGEGSTKTATDVLIFIHGITTGFDPEKNAHVDQLKSYETLRSQVEKLMEGHTKGEEWKNAKLVNVLWGFDGTGGDGNKLTGDHTRLAKAQRFLGQRTDKIEEQNQGKTIHPVKPIMRKARSPVRYGMADMFFYVSRAGRPLIRQAVAEQIMNKAVNELVEKGKSIELTLFGHSAGSVVAHDFVFFINRAKDLTPEQIDKASNSFAGDDRKLLENLHKLIDHARAGKVKIRKLFTFGSPLHILFIRSLPVLRSFSDDNPKGVDPEIYGLTEDYPGATYPRWINILDDDDPIAGPVCGAIDETLNTAKGKPIVEDVYLDTTWKISAAHGSYWWSEKFAKTVRDRW